MFSSLFNPLGAFRQCSRLLRMPDARPGRMALVRARLSFCCRNPESGPARARLGPLALYAHTEGELAYLFGEVFVRREYYVDLRRPDPLIVDCGANIGFATLFFKLHYPAARILAFEPNPSCFKLLQRHIEENQLRDVTAIQSACGKDNGQVSFFVSRGFSPLSSIHGGRAENAEEIKVKLVKLSDHITEDVDLLKLDVEGAEWDVLADLVESGKLARVRRMAIEYHHRIGGAKSEMGSFLKILEDAGFNYDIEANLHEEQRFAGLFQDVMIYANRPGVK